MWRTKRSDVARILARSKALWIEGNPYYERVEGVVAGTPSLSVYDVILDAGSSVNEDPASAVPFDLELADGRVLRKPGNLFNLTEGMLWGTLPQYTAKGVKRGPRRRREGRVRRGAAGCGGLQGGRRRVRRCTRASSTRRRAAWKPTASDAFTAVVVMVPTMSEYFGQWKVSRFVLGNRAKGDAFNVVSRLSDIGDILGGLRVIYAGIGPAIATVDPQQAAQTKRELDSLWSFVAQAAQAGAGRAPLHARAGRHARTNGPGARLGDRGPGDAGRSPTQGEDRAVA